MWKKIAFLCFIAITLSLNEAKAVTFNEKDSLNNVATVYLYRNSTKFSEYQNIKVVCNGIKLCKLSGYRYLVKQVPANEDITFVLHEARFLGLYSKKFVKTIKPQAGKTYYFLLDNQGIYGRKIIDVSPLVGEEEIKRLNPDHCNKKLVSSKK